MKKVVNQIVNAPKDSDKMLLEMEEKMDEKTLKLEKPDFQMRMMSMLFESRATRDQCGPSHQPFPMTPTACMMIIHTTEFFLTAVM